MSAAVAQDVAQEFAEALAARLGEELVQVTLFGSRARGEGRWRSDYDFMVVLRNASGEARSAIHRVATRFELDRNVDLSTKIVDVERFAELRRSSMPFWRNYARDEKVLWPATRSQSA